MLLGLDSRPGFFVFMSGGKATKNRRYTDIFICSFELGRIQNVQKKRISMRHRVQEVTACHFSLLHAKTNLHKEKNMKINKTLPTETLNAATAVLSPYIPDLSPTVLMKALETYNENKEPTAQKSSRPEKPYTRQEAAELLGVALPTIDRYMANGTLKRIRYSAHSVRITQESVHNLMEGGVA